MSLQDSPVYFLVWMFYSHSAGQMVKYLQYLEHGDVCELCDQALLCDHFCREPSSVRDFLWWLRMRKFWIMGRVNWTTFVQAELSCFTVKCKLYVMSMIRSSFSPVCSSRKSIIASHWLSILRWVICFLVLEWYHLQISAPPVKDYFFCPHKLLYIHFVLVWTFCCNSISYFWGLLSFVYFCNKNFFRNNFNSTTTFRFCSPLRIFFFEVWWKSSQKAIFINGCKFWHHDFN